MARNGNVNIADLEAFRKQMEENLNQAEIQRFIEQCAKELAARLLAKVIKRTPVGQKPDLGDVETVQIKVATSSTVRKKVGNGFIEYQRKTMKNRSFLTAKGARVARAKSYWEGYKGGTLRRGWTAGKQQDPTAYAQSLNVTRTGDMYTIEIVNPVEYAPYVEYGHRQEVGRFVPAIGKSLKRGWVEGKFMLTISSQEVQRDAPRILEQKLKRKLEECFK